MEAASAALEGEKRAGVAALLDCAANAQETHQRPRLGTNTSSAVGVLKLLQLLTCQPLLDGRNTTNRGGNERDRSATEALTEGETGRTRKAARRRPGWSDPRSSPVAPLRFEHDVSAAHFKLLSTKRSQSKRLPLRTRQYVFEPAPKPAKPTYRAAINSIAVDVAVTRATAVQTTPVAEDKVVQPSCPSSPLLLPSNQASYCPSTDCIAVEAAADKRVIDRRSVKEDKAVDVQCQLRDPTPRPRAAPSGIADRFPIWIDLNTSSAVSNSSAQSKKFLQVVTFTDNPIDIGSNLLIVPRAPIPIVRDEDVESESPEEDDVHPVDAEPADIVDETQMENAAQAAKAHRERYRLHYASSVANTESKRSAEGVEALVEVQNDMEQMKQRLLELEQLADSMDYDFKLSYQILGGDDDVEQENDKLRAQLTLNQIDRVLVDTAEPSGDSDEPKQAPPMGILAQKAANDATAARALLEQIEQLTMEEGDAH